MAITKNKPARPFKNIQDCANRFRSRSATTQNGYPCLRCNGEGGVHNWRDHDPVEGFKHAPRYECPECKGTGLSSYAKFRQYYKKRIMAWRTEVDEWTRLHELKVGALKKLSVAEIEALILLGLE